MSTDAEGSEAFEQVCAELIEGILAGEIDRDSVEAKKTEVCGKYSSPKVPKNTELLDRAPEDRREELVEVQQFVFPHCIGNRGWRHLSGATALLSRHTQGGAAASSHASGRGVGRAR